MLALYFTDPMAPKIYFYFKWNRCVQLEWCHTILWCILSYKH